MHVRRNRETFRRRARWRSGNACSEHRQREQSQAETKFHEPIDDFLPRTLQREWNGDNGHASTQRQRPHVADVRALPGSGAAGGLAGGLAALGATLVPGFDVVADALSLAERLEGVGLVVTGEGFLDAQSFAGKAVGGVVDLAREADVPVVMFAQSSGEPKR